MVDYGIRVKKLCADEFLYSTPYRSLTSLLRRVALPTMADISTRRRLFPILTCGGYACEPWSLERRKRSK